MENAELKRYIPTRIDSRGISFLEKLKHAVGVADGVVRGLSRFFAAISAGSFLGVLLGHSFYQLPRYGGWLSSIPIASMVGAIGVIIGAGMVAIGKKMRRPADFLFLLLILLLMTYVYRPLPPIILVVCSVLFGGMLALLPSFRDVYRLGFSLSFVIFSVLPFFRFSSLTHLLMVGSPLLFILAVLSLRTHWITRVMFCIAIPYLVWTSTFTLTANRESQISPEPPPLASALPVSLLPVEDVDARTVLFISSVPSPMLYLLSAFPYVEQADIICKEPGSLGSIKNDKINFYFDSPGWVLPKLRANYDLIYLEEIPSGLSQVRRYFITRVWKKLKPDRGVLVLPVSASGDLPKEVAKALIVPGSNGMLLAASPNASLTADIELLEQRLDKLLSGLGEHISFIPAGIFTALYWETDELDLEVPSPIRENPCPIWFWGVVVLVIATYLLLCLGLGRYIRVASGFALVENGAEFALLLMVATFSLASQELLNGVPWQVTIAMLGFVMFSFTSHLRTGRILVGLALVLAFLWLCELYSPWLELACLFSLCLESLATGTVYTRVSKVARFSGSVAMSWSGLGFATGSALFWLLSSFFPNPILPALLVATFLRIIWLIKA